MQETDIVDYVSTWILTFDRPAELNRLIKHLNQQSIVPNVFSNHPKAEIEKHLNVGQVVINTLNEPESSSWCARSWNNIFIKAFNKPAIPTGIICLQDDTDVADTFGDWINEFYPRYDLIWGPAGDQFFYVSWELFKKTGWWDERYLGCYCGDAEWMRRCYLSNHPVDRLSVVDTHNWGFVHNDIGLRNHIITTYESKTFSGCYENQHWDFEKRAPATVRHSQALYKKKWGVDLDINQPNWLHGALESKIGEIDWYPWFSKKHGFNDLYDSKLEGK